MLASPKRVKMKYSEKQWAYHAQLIQKIQINKKNVFSGDEDRKEFMLSRFGVDSLKDMTIDQLRLMLDFCLRKVSDIPMLHKVDGKALITEAQKMKIKGLWKEKARDKSDITLFSFIKRVSGADIIVLDDLLKGKATKVIVALENMKT